MRETLLPPGSSVFIFDKLQSKNITDGDNRYISILIYTPCKRENVLIAMLKYQKSIAQNVGSRKR